ncbi:MAG: hypothetical protein E6J20_18675, partial [Chloroflexi bacterium]
CSCPDDAVNTKIASLVAVIAHLSRSRRSPSVHVHIDDPELARLLRGPLASVGAARFHFFNTAAVWARAVLADPAGPLAKPSATPRVLVLGTTSLGRAVVVAAARGWHEHVRSTGSGERARIAVAGADATRVCADMAERYPAIPRVCDLIPVSDSHATGFPARFGDALGAGPGSVAVYCCLDDQSANLAAALDADHRLQGQAPVFLPAEAAAAALGPLLLGAGRIHAVALPAAGAALELLHDHMREALAREAHDSYLAQRRLAADFGERPADRPWEELEETYRRANRRQVDGMVDQLQAVWYELEPRYDWDEPLLELSLTDVETMARLEHTRWCRERRSAGWKPGQIHDAARKIHNRLVPWDELPEQDKDLDRAAAKSRPSMLAQAGFRLARDPAREDLARMLHEHYLEARQADGTDTPSSIEWSELSEPARERNRAAIDDFALKLAHIGCRATRRALGPSEEAVITPAELETLAELEHQRWTDERRASGWSLGQRDDEARKHPSLVAWPELPESEREKDREQIRAIPDLLAAIDYAIVRDDPERRPRRRRPHRTRH